MRAYDICFYLSATDKNISTPFFFPSSPLQVTKLIPCRAGRHPTELCCWRQLPALRYLSPEAAAGACGAVQRIPALLRSLLGRLLPPAASPAQGLDRL